MKNILKETAHRRMQSSSSSGSGSGTGSGTGSANIASISPPVVDLTETASINNGIEKAAIPFISCPLCEFQDLEVEMMSRHIANCHPQYDGPVPDGMSGGSANIAATQGGFGTGGGGGTERCPICQQCFSDAIELVNHCERVHYEQQSQSSNNNAGTTRNNGSRSGSASKSGCYIA